MVNSTGILKKKIFLSPPAILSTMLGLKGGHPVVIRWQSVENGATNYLAHAH